MVRRRDGFLFSVFGFCVLFCRANFRRRWLLLVIQKDVEQVRHGHIPQSHFNLFMLKRLDGYCTAAAAATTTGNKRREMQFFKQIQSTQLDARCSSFRIPKQTRTRTQSVCYLDIKTSGQLPVALPTGRLMTARGAK